MESYEKYKETNLFNGCSFKLKVFEVIHKQYSIMKLHWHEYLEILYFAEGQATMNIGSATHHVSAGDILFVNSRQIHSGCSEDNSLVKYYAIVIDPSLLAGDAHDPNYRKFILPFMDGTRLFPVKPEKRDSHYRKLKNYMKTMIAEYKAELPGYEVKIKSSLYSLIVELFRGYLPVAPVDTGGEECVQDIKNIKSLISHIYLTCPSKMTVRDAARYVKLSPYYFCKVFKKATGWTFIEFLNIYKINKAEEFLMYTNDPITSIASDLGFCSPNYFNRIFKRLKGYSPSAYRKQKSNMIYKLAKEAESRFCQTDP